MSPVNSEAARQPAGTRPRCPAVGPGRGAEGHRRDARATVEVLPLWAAPWSRTARAPAAG